jgi:hypothetical protein
VAAVVLPLSLFFLFERQARRLDALATHGEAVEARVTAAQDGSTFYAYQVGGRQYSWEVKRTDAPFDVGHVFSATYLPEDPSFSRPIFDRSLATREAAATRHFSAKTCAAVALFFLIFAGLVHGDVRRFRAGAPSEVNDPEGYRRCLRWVALTFLPVLLLLGDFAIRDAVERSESVVPGLIGLGLGAGILGGILYSAGRIGPVQAQARFAKITRWLAPVAVGFALLRLVLLLVKR